MKGLRDCVVAAFLGTAIGDALGAPIEGLSWKKREAFGRIEDYCLNPDHPWNGRLENGQWTDDTQLTLVVAESLIANGGRINMDDMAARHVAALEEAKRDGIGWGRTTTLAVERLKAGVHWSESGKNLGEKCGAGNGVAMKMVPLAVLLSLDWSDDDEGRYQEVRKIFQLGCMTHTTLCGLAAGFVQGQAISFCLEQELAVPDNFYPRLSCIASQISYVSDEDIPSAGLERLLSRLSLLGDVSSSCDPEWLATEFGAKGFHAADSIPTVLAFFLRKPYSIETLYDVVNAGGDSDSNGAMVGALLGALNGMRIFPKHLIDGLRQREQVVDTANRLCDVLRIK